MGNICCQTQIISSQLQTDVIKLKDYQDTQIPQNDQQFNKWLTQNNIQIKNQSNSQNDSSKEKIKMMKNKKQNLYYYGGWLNGTSQGRGILYKPEKVYFHGNFKDGIPQGQALIKCIQQGYIFDGLLKQGKAHGKGKIVSEKQNYQFEGDWDDSKPKSGVLTFTNDGNVQKIDFTDYPSGQGKIYYKDQRVYQGGIDLIKLSPQGTGKITFGDTSNSHKRQYEGQLQNGLMHGKGKLIMKDDTIYEGDYKNGKRQGQGKFIFKSKNYYQGHWQDGKQHGEGALYNQKGELLKKGIWQNGKFKQQQAQSGMPMNESRKSKQHGQQGQQNEIHHHSRTSQNKQSNVEV